MKLFFRISVVAILFTLVFSQLAPQISATEENDASTTSYEQMKKEGKLDPDTTKEQYSELQTQLQQDKIEEKKEVSSDEFQNDTSTRAKFKLKPGDILVTNASGSNNNGLTGHAAIAKNSKSVVEMPGYGKHIRTIKFSKFRHNHKTGKGKYIKVYRVSSKKGKKAAKWAAKQSKNKKLKYSLGMNILNKHYSYCSKLVWQAYYYGAGKNTVRSKRSQQWVTPYKLAHNIKGAKKVKTYK